MGLWKDGISIELVAAAVASRRSWLARSRRTGLQDREVSGHSRGCMSTYSQTVFSPKSSLLVLFPLPEQIRKALQARGQTSTTPSPDPFGRPGPTRVRQAPLTSGVDLRLPPPTSGIVNHLPKEEHPRKANRWKCGIEPGERVTPVRTKHSCHGVVR